MRIVKYVKENCDIPFAYVDYLKHNGFQDKDKAQWVFLGAVKQLQKKANKQPDRVKAFIDKYKHRKNYKELFASNDAKAYWKKVKEDRKLQRSSELRRRINEKNEAELRSYLSYAINQLNALSQPNEDSNDNQNDNVEANQNENVSNGDSTGTFLSADRHPKRKRVVEYLKGNGEKDWDIGGVEWPIEFGDKTIDIMKYLKDFRKHSIKGAEVHNNLDDLRILSLSHIFPFNRYNINESVYSYLPVPLREVVMKEVESYFEKLDTGVSENNENDYSSIRNLILKAIEDGKSIESIKECLSQVNNIPQSEMALQILIKNLSKVIQQSDRSSEATFTFQSFMPFIDELYCQNDSPHDSFYYWYDKVMDAPDLNVKPDFFFGMKERKLKFHVFVVEVKKDENDTNEVESDFVKLQRELQKMLDFQIKHNVENPTGYGILQRGYECELYQMLLLKPRVYVPLMVKKFYVLRDFIDLVHAPRTIESLILLKSKIESLFYRITTRKGNPVIPEKSYQCNTFKPASFKVVPVNSSN